MRLVPTLNILTNHMEELVQRILSEPPLKQVAIKEEIGQTKPSSWGVVNTLNTQLLFQIKKYPLKERIPCNPIKMGRTATCQSSVNPTCQLLTRKTNLK